MLSKRFRWGFLACLVIAVVMLPNLIHAEEQADESRFYYYILIDRYENGAPDTSDLIDRDDPAGFHGGDFQGIINRVNHLAQTGVTHVIVSPIFQSADYLGQSLISLDQIHETYGDESDLTELVNHLNGRDIELIVELPIHSVNEASEMYEADWVDETGKIDLSSELAIDYLTTRLNEWTNEGIDGFYVPELDPNDLEGWSTITELVDTYWIAGMAENIEEGLGVFDQVIRFDDSEETFDYLRGFDADFASLTEREAYTTQDVIQFIDFKHTDRFTRSLEEIGTHPVTRWQLALTYLFTAPNEPIIFQGTEIPSDGEIADLSTHRLVNYLTGDDQITKHVEKLASIRQNYPAIHSGSFEVLHEEDGFFVFSRELDDEKVYVTVNTTETTQEVHLDDLDSELELRGIIEDELVREVDGVYTLVTDREAANIFVLGEDSGIYWPLVSLIIIVMGLFIGFSIYMYTKKT